MPNFVDMEMQVLSGILPISRVSAVPACIYYVSHYLPLEELFRLQRPSTNNPPKQDKRTWREDMERPSIQQEDYQEDHKWTAMDILVAYAAVKKWVTAKAGRPDVNRVCVLSAACVSGGKY